MIKQLKARLAKAHDAHSETQETLAEIRALTARLKDERDAIRAAPVPLETAQARAAAAIEEEATLIWADVPYAAFASPSSDVRAALDLRDGHRAFPGAPGEPLIVLPRSGRASRLAFAAMSETIIAQLQKRLAAHYQATGIEGIDDDARAAEVARIDDEIAAAERAEEALIRALEATGNAPLRRADADPRALLAADAALP
jgi:hypothetical protein